MGPHSSSTPEGMSRRGDGPARCPGTRPGGALGEEAGRLRFRAAAVLAARQPLNKPLRTGWEARDAESREDAARGGDPQGPGLRLRMERPGLSPGGLVVRGVRSASSGQRAGGPRRRACSCCCLIRRGPGGAGEGLRRAGPS